jgi:radical SAM superfamily enzyme
MKILNRENDISHVEIVVKQLNDAGIKYSISIIFGIPYQTVESFRQTIEFIEKNNCTEFYAYPLQLPKNSKMRERIEELKIKEFQGEHFSLGFVSECSSFNKSDWGNMCNIAESKSGKSIFLG